MSRALNLVRTLALVFLVYSLTLHPALLNMLSAGLDVPSIILAAVSSAVLLFFCGLAAYAYFSRGDVSALLLLLGLTLLLYAVCLEVPALLNMLEHKVHLL